MVSEALSVLLEGFHGNATLFEGFDAVDDGAGGGDGSDERDGIGDGLGADNDLVTARVLAGDGVDD